MFWKRKTPPNMHAEMLPVINTRLADASPQAIIAWAASTYGTKLCLATMLDAEGCALVAMLAETKVDIPIYMLDTGYLSEETLALYREVQHRFGATIRIVSPSLFHAIGEVDYGPLVERSPAMCCRLKRWEPMQSVLEQYDARLAARRRAACLAMRDVEITAWEDSFDLVQVNPLASWSDTQLVQYLEAQKIPIRTKETRQWCTVCPRLWDDIVPTHEQLHGPTRQPVSSWWASWR